MMPTRRMCTSSTGWLVGLALLLAVGLTACDTSVEPFVQPEQPFSIVGALEAGRDTQSIRVTAVDDSVAYGAPPEPLDAVVTTEHMASGRVTTWRDSLVRLRQVREEGVAETRWVHNVWTTADFEPAASYRFAVTGPAGRSSSATVTLPDTSFDIEVIPPEMSPYWRIRVRGVERLADMIVVLEEKQPSGWTETSAFSVVADTVPQGLDGYAVRVRGSEISQRLQGQDGATRGRVRVSLAGPDWPAISGIDSDSLLQPGIISNVENGYGYLGGVATKTALLFGPRAADGDR